MTTIPKAIVTSIPQKLNLHQECFFDLTEDTFLSINNGLKITPMGVVKHSEEQQEEQSLNSNWNEYLGDWLLSVDNLCSGFT